MGKIFLIAGREMHTFFNTWTGYLIAACALLIDGLLFNAFAVGSREKLSADVLSDFFYFSSGISMVAAIFLAMRLVAEERQNKTILLYFTSPVSERAIIYGKFLSALTFFLFLHALSVYLPALILIHGKISLGHIAVGYLGLCLLGASVIAMVLLASVLAPNQLLAGVLGAVMVVVFLVMWMLSDIVDAPLKELYSYIAIHNDHFTPFSRGIINTCDVVYYLSLVVFFLECSVSALKARRWQG